MALRIITPPAVEPISLPEAKAHLNVTFDDDDLLIQAAIQAARQYAEEYMQRAIITQTLELVIDKFPSNEIELPRPPLQSVNSIKYFDSGGFDQTVSPSEYTVDDVSQPGWVVPELVGWPTNVFDGINAVRIQYVAGWAPNTDSPPSLTANVPRQIINAMLLHLGMLYEHRENLIAGANVYVLPWGATDWLLRQYRVARGMA